MNPFSKRIHQIKNPDLDLPKGTRNPFLDLKSVFGFTESNTPYLSSDWLKNNQLLSELTHAHYREPVPLTIVMKIEMYYLTRRQRCQFPP